MKTKVPLLLAASLLMPLASSQAALVLIDFGATNSGLAGYNEITSLPGASPVNLIDTTGASSGISLISSGGAANGGSGAGVSSAIPRSVDTENEWSAITGGESLATVNSQGLAFSGNQTFTLSGLTVGERYSIMLLSGVQGSGGNYGLSFTGVDSDYTYTGYDQAAGRTPSYNAGTDVLTWASPYHTSGTSSSLRLDFTATSPDLSIFIGNAAVRGGIQAIALIPEPSSALLGGLGALVLLRRRRND